MALLIVRTKSGEVRHFSAVHGAHRFGGFVSWYDRGGNKHHISLAHIDRAFNYMGAVDPVTGLVRLV